MGTTQPEWQRCKCGAGWLGHYWERCDWCWSLQELALVQRRKQLLQPDWMQKQGPKYWELSEVDRQVWDTTRGIQRGANVEEQWGRELVEAVEAEIISPDEYMGVLKRWTLMKNSLGGINQSNLNP